MKISVLSMLVIQTFTQPDSTQFSAEYSLAQLHDVIVTDVKAKGPKNNVHTP